MKWCDPKKTRISFGYSFQLAETNIKKYWTKINMKGKENAKQSGKFTTTQGSKTKKRPRKGLEEIWLLSKFWGMQLLGFWTLVTHQEKSKITIQLINFRY